MPPHGDLDEPLAVDRDGGAARSASGTRSSPRRSTRCGPRPAPTDDASIVRIWPEHFDAAIDMGDQAASRRGTYGGSPGDGHHAEPYLYVSPWAGRIDDFFGDPTFKGASLFYSQLVAEADPMAAALEFLREARDRIQRHV